MIAITEALRRFCVDRVGLPAAKVEVVHYGLDALPAPWGGAGEVPVPEGARVLLCVGRLAEQKGIDVAVRALARIREREPAAVLVVLGEGPERARAGGASAARASICPAASVTSPRGTGAPRCSSTRPRWEGFGLALLEAMVAGKPVVATGVELGSGDRRWTAKRGCWCRRTTRLRWPRRRWRCSPTLRARRRWARQASRGREESSRSRRWPTGPAAVYASVSAER